MKFNITFKNSCVAIAVAVMAVVSGCTPDEVTSRNPLTEDGFDATYTVVSVTDTVFMDPILKRLVNGKNYVVAPTADDNARVQYHTWRGTDKASAYVGNNIVTHGKQTAKYTFSGIGAGTFKIQHRVVGRVGGTNTTTEQSFALDFPEIPLPPVVDGPNIIKSPNFEKPADWTAIIIDAGGNAKWTFSQGKATIAGTTGHAAIYQAVTVEAGRTYEFDMNVSGPGSKDTWFEVYISPTAPTPNADYSAGGKRLQLNTWAGCATSPFDGLLSVVGCGLQDVSGSRVKFDKSGTVYFLIKSGGNINEINVSNVTFHTID
jgi:hypothetical protein